MHRLGTSQPEGGTPAGIGEILFLVSITQECLAMAVDMTTGQDNAGNFRQTRLVHTPVWFTSLYAGKWRKFKDLPKNLGAQDFVSSRFCLLKKGQTGGRQRMCRRCWPCYVRSHEAHISVFPCTGSFHAHLPCLPRLISCTSRSGLAFAFPVLAVVLSLGEL
ncbi:hypothetical protein VTK26DRAFT_7334 [Humicola hyalothermophila]